jgi:hypothetical protein
MVLELGDQDAVAALQELAVGIGDQVDRRGAAAGEDDLHRLHAEELRDIGARGLVKLGRRARRGDGRRAATLARPVVS